MNKFWSPKVEGLIVVLKHGSYISKSNVASVTDFETLCPGSKVITYVTRMVYVAKSLLSDVETLS